MRICATPAAAHRTAHAQKCTEPVAPSSGFPTDLRRSGCRSENHQPRTLRTRCKQHPRGCLTGRQAAREKNRPQIPAKAFADVSSRTECVPTRPFQPIAELSSCPSRRNPKRNAPSRWRLRPAFRLTSAEAGADRRAIDLGRSVLGASSTLGGAGEAVKTGRRRTSRNLRFFLYARVELRTPALVRVAWREENGPGSRPTRRSSPSRERFRPPSRRTFRFRVVLLGGLRPTGAPCSAQRGHYAMSTRSFKGMSTRICPYLRIGGRS